MEIDDVAGDEHQVGLELMRLIGDLSLAVGVLRAIAEDDVALGAAGRELGPRLGFERRDPGQVDPIAEPLADRRPGRTAR